MKTIRPYYFGIKNHLSIHNNKGIFFLMYALLSPAKTLKFDPVHLVMPQTEPLFKKQTKALVDKLKKFSISDIQKLMSISNNLAVLNAKRYKDFDRQPEKQALLAFQGGVYQGLDAASLSEKELIYAGNHIGILSGLYGLLKASDLIKPYRLEMGSLLSIEGNKNLYDYWQEQITQAINDHANKVKATHIINLASNEYSKVIQKDRLQKPIIDIEFKEIKADQEPRIIGVYAKKARGLMARFLIVNRSKTPDDLKKFTINGYRFDKQGSTEQTMIFVRTHSL